MGYQTEREQFIRDFARAFPDAPYSACLNVLRTASAEQRWNEVYSSFDIGEKETARQEKRSERRIERLRQLAASIGAEIETAGDPRGNPFTIRKIGDTSAGLSVPGRGLPARCFA